MPALVSLCIDSDWKSELLSHVTTCFFVHWGHSVLLQKKKKKTKTWLPSGGRERFSWSIVRFVGWVPFSKASVHKRDRFLWGRNVSCFGLHNVQHSSASFWIWAFRKLEVTQRSNLIISFTSSQGCKMQTGAFSPSVEEGKEQTPVILANEEGAWINVQMKAIIEHFLPGNIRNDVNAAYFNVMTFHRR